jgi:hypothetical protein
VTVCPFKSAWAPKKAIRVEGSASASATRPKTAGFAQSTGSRLGTAANDERIMPVEYSPVITSTPSTPTPPEGKITRRFRGRLLRAG